MYTKASVESVSYLLTYKENNVLLLLIPFELLPFSCKNDVHEHVCVSTSSSSFQAINEDQFGIRSSLLPIPKEQWNTLQSLYSSVIALI